MLCKAHVHHASAQSTGCTPPPSHMRHGLRCSKPCGRVSWAHLSRCLASWTTAPPAWVGRQSGRTGGCREVHTPGYRGLSRAIRDNRGNSRCWPRLCHRRELLERSRLHSRAVPTSLNTAGRLCQCPYAHWPGPALPHGGGGRQLQLA